MNDPSGFLRASRDKKSQQKLRIVHTIKTFNRVAPNIKSTRKNTDAFKYFITPYDGIIRIRL